MDAMEAASSGTAEKLQTSGTNTAAITNEYGGITTTENGVKSLNIEASPSWNYFEMKAPPGFYILANEDGYNIVQQYSDGKEKCIKLNKNNGIKIVSDSGEQIRLELVNSNMGIFMDKGDFEIYSAGNKLYTAGGSLYFNGKKVLLEG